MLLNYEWVKEGILKIPGTNENENMIHGFWDTLKAVLWGKFIALSACIKQLERVKQNDLQLSVLEEQK